MSGIIAQVRLFISKEYSILLVMKLTWKTHELTIFSEQILYKIDY